MTLRPGLTDILGIILIVALVLSGQTFVGDPGVGWHLRTGQWIAEHHSVPTQDLFLVGAESVPWVANQWLADLIFWQVWQLGGFPLLHVLGILLALIPYVVIIPEALSSGREKSLLVFLATLAAALLGAVQWFLRPVLFSFSLFAVLHFFLNSERRNRKTDFIFIGILFALWANLHPGFVLGLVLVGVAAMLGAVSWVCWFAAVLGTLANPYGALIFAPTVALLRSSYFMNLNEEWLSLDAHAGLFVPCLIVMTLLIALSRYAREALPTAYQTITLVLFFAMALLQRRYIPFFGIVAVPVLYRFLVVWQLSLRERQLPLIRQFAVGFSGTQVMWSAAVSCALVCFTAWNHRLPFRSAESSEFRNADAKAAVDFIKSANDNGVILASPNFGGYLAWEFYPERRVFVDDRNDVAGQERYENFFRVYQGRPGWSDVITENRIAWLLVENDSPLRILLNDNSGWEKIEIGSDAKLNLYRRL